MNEEIKYYVVKDKRNLQRYMKEKKCNFSIVGVNGFGYCIINLSV